MMRALLEACQKDVAALKGFLPVRSAMDNVNVMLTPCVICVISTRKLMRCRANAMVEKTQSPFAPSPFPPAKLIACSLAASLLDRRTPRRPSARDKSLKLYAPTSAGLLAPASRKGGGGHTKLLSSSFDVDGAAGVGSG